MVSGRWQVELAHVVHVPDAHGRLARAALGPLERRDLAGGAVVARGVDGHAEDVVVVALEEALPVARRLAG